MDQKPAIGSFQWADLTVTNAEEVRDFYKQVIGYTHTEVPMGDYADFCMNSPSDGSTSTGICHARGVNADLPPVWLIYFTVENLDHALENVKRLGGKVIKGPNTYGGSSRYAIIQDNAGAYCALFQA